MDYKKKYEEAIFRMNKWVEGSEIVDPKEVAEFVFPELKESEDESIRKALIQHIKDKVSVISGWRKEELIAWLEKRGEQPNKVSIWKHWNNGIIGNCDNVPTYLVKNGSTYTLTSCLGFECDYIELSELDKLMVEKQGEQKPVDKVEPKFKASDWVVGTITDRVEQIIEVTNNEYICSGTLIVSFDNQHLLKKWTIQDAKPGDVLASYECLVLFKEVDGPNIKCYCTYHFMNHEKFYVNTLQNKTAFCPATKEQRDQLEKAITAAGYEWDAEKKELKKIEQNPAEWEYSFGKNTTVDNLIGIAECLEMDGDCSFNGMSGTDCGKFLRELARRESVEQKPKMIQWTGDNLKEFVDFTGKSPMFDKWFKTWEEFEAYVHAHNDIFMLFDENGNHYEIPVGAWIVKTPDGYNVASKTVFKPKSTWSEEDKINLEKVIWYVENPAPMVVKDSMLVDWLRFLEARVQSQSEQEWSEEDENRFRNLVYLVEHSDEGKGTKEGFVKFINRLKSLKERYTWKPSDEQMKALNYVVNLMASSESPTENDYYYNVFKAMRTQLKKLKEE